MVSGDNLQTAIAVAKETAIIKGSDDVKENQCMSGERFRELVNKYAEITTLKDQTTLKITNSQEFSKLLARVKVIARAEPIDKLALVLGLQESGYLVACTGEGLNDAQALKQADVGFAMGSGCELAKDQADMIILDDNFGSTMTAVSWGRNIYDNVKKFIQFQMSVNISCCFIVLFSALFYGTSCFSVLHLLWINLIMDTFAALALATEPPNSKNIKSRPVKGNQQIISKIMWRQILSQSLWQVVVLIILLFATPAMLGKTYPLFNPE